MIVKIAGQQGSSVMDNGQGVARWIHLWWAHLQEAHQP
jgi:hypothetical protein